MGIAVISRKAICAAVPARWAEQYKRDVYGSDKAKITQGLKDLAPHELTPERINAVIGNTSWTENRCDVCGEDCEHLLRIGDEPDYEARWQDVCSWCLEKAVETLDATQRADMLAHTEA